MGCAWMPVSAGVSPIHGPGVPVIHRLFLPGPLRLLAPHRESEGWCQGGPGLVLPMIPWVTLGIPAPLQTSLPIQNNFGGPLKWSSLAHLFL